MRPLPALALLLILVPHATAQTASSQNAETKLSGSTKDEWSLYFNVSGYLVPHDRSYASPVFSADRNKIHLAARYNYEDKETGSVWLGYNFYRGNEISLEATPMIGGVLGNTAGIAPGYKAALAWKRLELSTEGEYVFDVRDHTGSFFYSWMELSYSPREWWRAGLVAQRTKAYSTSLDIQRGLLFGVSGKNTDLTAYLFNAGWTDPTVVLSLGFKF
jgi:hypothetical protein